MNDRSHPGTRHSGQGHGEPSARSVNHLDCADNSDSDPDNTPDPTPSPDVVHSPPSANFTTMATHQAQGMSGLTNRTQEGVSLFHEAAASVPSHQSQSQANMDSPANQPVYYGQGLHKYSVSNGSSIQSHTTTPSSSMHSHKSSTSTMGDMPPFPQLQPADSTAMSKSAPGVGHMPLDPEQFMSETTSTSTIQADTGFSLPAPVQEGQGYAPPTGSGQLNAGDNWTGVSGPLYQQHNFTNSGSNGFEAAYSVGAHNTAHSAAGPQHGYAHHGYPPNNITENTAAGGMEEQTPSNEGEESGQSESSPSAGDLPEDRIISSIEPKSDDFNQNEDDDAERVDDGESDSHASSSDAAHRRHSTGDVTDRSPSGEHVQFGDAHVKQASAETPPLGSVPQFESGPNNGQAFPVAEEQLTYGQLHTGNNSGRTGGGGAFDLSLTQFHDEPGSRAYRDALRIPHSGQKRARSPSPTDDVFGFGSRARDDNLARDWELRAHKRVIQDNPPASSALRAHKRVVSAPDFPQASGSAPATGYEPGAPIQYNQEHQPSHVRQGQYSSNHPAYGAQWQSGGVRDQGPDQARYQQGLDDLRAIRQFQDEDAPERGEQGGDATRRTTSLALADPAVLMDCSHKRCLFVNGCETGSQLRKVISHIFGRNKLCTRQIPEELWVHFCRKHYQRCRYRHLIEFAKLVIELVLVQINRLEAWSDENKAAGKLGVLEGWTMDIRKREKKRIEERNPSLERKSPHEVPQWLRDHVHSGKKFSSAEVIDMFLTIKKQLEDGILTDVPDIEILPSITHDPKAAILNKRYDRRPRGGSPASVNGNGTGHRRQHRYAQSTGSMLAVGRDLVQYTPSSIPRVPPPSAMRHDYFSSRDYASDYRRPHQEGTRVDYQSMNVVPRNESHIVPTIRYSAPTPSALPPFLPAPVAQRPGIQSTAEHLESSGSSHGYDYTHHGHHRSQSDQVNYNNRYPPHFPAEPPAPRFTAVNSQRLGTPNHHHPYTTSTSPLHPPTARPPSYGQSLSEYKAEPGFADFPPPVSHPSFTRSTAASLYPGPVHPDPYDANASSSARGYGHARHQSTPTLNHTSQPTMFGSNIHSTPALEGYPPGSSHGYSRGPLSDNNRTYGQGSFANNNNNNNDDSQAYSDAYINYTYAQERGQRYEPAQPREPDVEN